MHRNHVLAFALLLSAGAASAFESTKTLPQGVRNLNIRGLYTSTSEKTDPNGNSISLAEALWRPLRFRSILSTEDDPLKRTQLEAFLVQQGISKEQSVGDFYADLNARINVWAPIVGWGLSNDMTLAVAVPYYSTSTDIEPGFRTNQGAEDFLARLTTDSMNNYGSAQEAVEKFRDAIGRLNRKLVKYNYSQLGSWNQTGWGDTTLALKYRAVNQDVLKFAVTGGVVVPTGRRDSPSILTDLPLGDGQWDVFSQLTFDQQLTSSVFLNQFARYTYQAPDRRRIPWKTYDESIEVPVNSTEFKYGDKVDGGLSVQYESLVTGVTAGLGALYYRKFGDRYEVSEIDSKNELQRWTDQNAEYAQARVGYSTVEAFRRKEFPLPASISMEYRRQLASRNTPITDFAQMDINLFF
ncbi:MAG TPA: hypothetical protein VE954_37895 [Oligoflexus sp.]|uniref:hypothetical protein n=1 Tax=Oligoflexus sp. TaxID=1971216 RepID=UPI002D617F52|nr:hypothetical protein [Oligoflexus sp.]HYX38915.1 hypothetical protein [Oligoflexus sp.]